MTLTGQSFDLDPKTFTLANMFAMQLHKYKDDIAKVTSSALKELTIENELRKLADVWKEQKFDFHKYNMVRSGQQLQGAVSCEVYALNASYKVRLPFWRLKSRLL